jgi:hypothetical protein
MDLLYEIANVRQICGEPTRRWFASLGHDLIVWIANGDDPVAFQLCYDKGWKERAITWRAGRGFDHARVDNGESIPGGYKGTPLLVPDGPFPKARVHDEFMTVAVRVPASIKSFVARRILRYPLGRK